MRMQENFSGCRVLPYCVMSNHFHLLLEVPPILEGGELERFTGLFIVHFEENSRPALRPNKSA